MFKYILLFVLISPLIGVYLMEEGAYGVDVGVTGYENGAFAMFLTYVTIVLCCFFVFRRIDILPFNNKMQESLVLGNSCYISFFFINLFYLFIMLFVFDGISVILGTQGKGLFRVSFGFFGALPYFIFRYFAPILLAYLAFDYKKVEKNSTKNVFLFLNIFVVILNGLTWGGKAAPLLLLVPFLIIYYWEVKFRNIFFIVLSGLIFMVFTAMYFDGLSLLGDENVFLFILNRMTVLQGNTAWYVWDLYTNGVKLPDYWPTLYAAFGDKFLDLFGGINLSNIDEFAKYHFDILLTSLATGNYDSRLEGHNITGTAFSDGVFIGGKIGVVFISVFAGFITGQCFNIIKRAIIYNRPITGSLTTVYFFSYVYTWLNGSGIVVLFHISAVLGLFVAWVYLKYVTKIRVTKKGVFFPKFNSI